MGLFKKTPTAEQTAEAATKREQTRREINACIHRAELDLRDAQQSNVPELAAEERKSIAAFQKMLRDL